MASKFRVCQRQHGCRAAMKKTNRTVMDNGSGYLFHGESHTVIDMLGGDSFEQDQRET